jgi:hypothetical protein
MSTQHVFWPSKPEHFLNRLVIDSVSGDIKFVGIQKGYFRWNTKHEGIADIRTFEAALRQQLAQFKSEGTDVVRTRSESMACCPFFFCPYVWRCRPASPAGS